MDLGHFFTTAKFSALGCLVWIPLTIWILSVVGWTVQGDIDLGTGLVGTVLAFVLGMFTMVPPRPEMAPVLFGASVATVVFFPVFRAVLNRHGMHQFEMEQIENAYELLKYRPDNAMNRFKLAKLLYAKGIRGHALTIGEEALKGMPRQVFEEEHRLLLRWKRSPTPPDLLRALRCMECGHMNQPGEVFCTQCQNAFLLDYAKGRWVGKTAGRRLMAGWAAMMVAIIGITLAGALHPPMSTLTGVLTFILFFTLLALGFWPGQKERLL